MNKKQNTVIGGYRIYTSLLYTNWFAVEYLEQCGEYVFRVRLPYNTLSRAEQMRNHLSGHVGSELRPDYKPQIHIIKSGIVR